MRRSDPDAPAKTPTLRRSGKRGNGEVSVYFQKSRGRWVGSLSLDVGKRKSVYEQTHQEVAKKLAEALQAREQGILIVARARQ